MSFNTIGKYLTLQTFGESHGPVIGGVIDGMPANIVIDKAYVQNRVNLRRANKHISSTDRIETDTVEWLSGIFENKTLGSPIAFIIKNNNTQPKDYNSIKEIYRPSHADFTYQQKYGIRDFRGGGRSSARETVCRVVGGAIAQHILDKYNIKVYGFVSQIGTVKLQKTAEVLDLSTVYETELRCPDLNFENLMNEEIIKAYQEGDTLGGTITCVVKNAPVGLGEPIYHKINAQLAQAINSINAVKGIIFGNEVIHNKKGSEINDLFEIENNNIKTKSNHSGGIQGGITNGMDIIFHVYFKPIASIKINQISVNQNLETIDFKIGGRHDVCVVPRAVPIVEAMTQLVLAEAILLQNVNNF